MLLRRSDDVTYSIVFSREEWDAFIAGLIPRLEDAADNAVAFSIS